MLEMEIVMRTVLSACELRPAEDGHERARRRNITVRPGAGARAALRARRPAGVAA
jgi:hypothetical protein